jgi:NADH-quinone oxidoreductase subunit M
MRDMRLSEGFVIAPLLFLIVFLGIYPAPMLERIEPSVQSLIEHVDREVEDFDEIRVGYIGAAEARDGAGHGGSGDHGEGEG